MAPRPQEQSGPQKVGEGAQAAADGERVVISGMAGLFPQARYVKDLEDILYNKLNPVSADALRWKYNHPEVAQYTGSVPGLDCFDAQFFKVHHKLGNAMDSMSRKMLEQAYEAIYDAGVNPVSLSGKKIGVYIGSCYSESEKSFIYKSSSLSGLGIAGCNKSMFANRISYWLNAKGPSMSIDQACCSSLAALDAAYKAIASGECEAAIAGGANLCLHPQSSVHFGRIMNISTDGKTKSFAEDATGCVKSEAVNCLFLQRAKNAKRIYADVMHIKTEFLSIINGETGPKYGFHRDPADTANFMKTFYDEAGVPPTLVEYVEAFGAAVPEADKSELEAIDKVFCSERRETLLVGSVMSNIGYGEAASGISAVTKVLLGYQRGSLAGNLHCSTPRRDVAAIREGRIRVLTDNQTFRRTYAAVNSMSLTGVNAHVLLNGHYKHKDLDRYKANIPRLVTISGRQDTAVERALGLLKSHPIDPEELALLHSIHETNTPGHLGKGYTIIDSNPDGETFLWTQRVEYCDGAQRPLWFVYSGMGSQWAGMGAQLMRIPIFAAAIERCRKILEPKGIDIVHIITSPDVTIFNNILHSFVGIAAVQIGLTDILLQLGLVPDKIIGHSVGELGCAYADGCLTAEEMILSAYSRGRVSLETPVIRGSMAAVGVGAQKMSSMCPPEIEIACHNSAESCTLSGPADAMRSFVADLTSRGIFAKEVPCSNIAYHSRYIAGAGPGLLKYLKEVIKTPRTRSERWVSSSVPQDRWNEPAAKYSSAEYHTNNLLSPVLFEEASALIPADAVMVEVAPHGLLQAILKRALPDSVTNIPLTRRGHKENVVMLLDAIGKLYIQGYTPKVQVLYPKVEYPVSTGTPFLSTYVEWAHEEKWSLPLHQTAHRTMTASCTSVISIHDDNCYLQGHVVGNKTLLPFSYALVAAWDTLAMSLDVPKKSLNVEFRDVKLYTQPILHEQKTVRLSVSLHRGTGLFEVMDGDSKIATGVINLLDQAKNIESISDSESASMLESNGLRVKDVYRILYERGYAYSGMFRSIHSTNSSVSEAKITWNDNWVTFIDGLFQLSTLKYTHSGVSQPDRIGRIVIDHKKQSDSTKINDNSENNMPSLLKVKLSDIQDRTSCGGVVIENMHFRNVLQTNDRVALQKLKFVPRFDSKFDVSTSLYVLLQIAAENINKDSIKVIGLSIDHHSKLSEEIEKITDKGIRGTKVQYQHMSISTALSGNEHAYEDVDIILVQKLSRCENISERLHRILRCDTFIVNEEDVTDEDIKVFPLNFYKIVSVLKNAQTRLELACWRPTPSTPMTSAFTVRTESDLSLLTHARNGCSTQNGFLIVTSYPPVSGLISLVKQWRKEASRNRIYVIMVNEINKNDLFSNEFPDVNLAFNMFDNGSWGGEYYLPFEETSAALRDEVTLQSEVIGDLNSLRWVQAPKLTSSGISVAVHYTAINVRDVKQALGLILRDTNKCSGFGMDFSGVTERGERVMGLVPSGAASTYVMAQPELMWPVPAYWSLEDAATVPLAYVYAYYCLVIQPKTRCYIDDGKKYSVLVHGGTGALGQAAITIALARGWRVFTTVGDSAKKRFLMKLFPQLNEGDIGNSRDSSFGDMVLSATNGKGCNVVLSCLKSELKNTSLNCCAPSSIVLDTTQILNKENYSYGMYNMMYDRSYIAVELTNIFNEIHQSKSEDVKKLHALVSEGIALGEVRPLSRVTFAPDEAARAFRLLAASQHRGRALLRLADEHASPRHRITPEAALPVHFIICDSSTLGVQLADKLIDSGIKNLRLHFNITPGSAGHLQYKLRIWKKKNIQVAVTYGDVEEIHDLISDVNSEFTEGLYIIAKSNLQENCIKKIDLATKSVCPSLKYFMVISNNGSGHYTCVQRAKSGLPATLLDLSLLETTQDADGGTWYHGAAVAAERALRSIDPVLIALPERTPRQTLVQQITSLAGLNVCNETSSSTSLEQLGMSNEKSSLVCAFLRDVYNVSFDEEHVPLLTLERLNQIKDKATVKQFKELKGLKIFYSFVDSDELRATTEIVFLPTLTNNNVMGDDEFDVNETYLCILPGLEGHHERFRTLCERLKMPAFVLQPGLDHPDETPTELAVRYSKVLLKRTCLKDKFYILGYETGVMVALELAAILEERGLTGTVFCLGDGPNEIVELLERELSQFPSAEALQGAVVRHMLALMARGSNVDMENVLRGSSSWTARMDACVRLLLGRVPHSAQYARALMEAAYARIGAAQRAVLAPHILSSRLVLLRAHRERDHVQETCSLQRYSRQAFHVRNLTTPMAHVTSDLKASAIINSYLDDDILQAFEKKNLCDTYLTNDRA